ncbi:hypothetical protein LCL95_05035 [Bacillus timonensis]|nr:hypothetical protein [Bacillus timonensis]
MFDPTIFDNLKVVLEGAVYDLDLDGDFEVIKRQDLIDLATMNRTYQICFSNTLRYPQIKYCFINLQIDLKNLAGELLSIDSTNSHLGCNLEVGLVLDINRVELCNEIKKDLLKIWGIERIITQELSFVYEEKGKPPIYHNKITIHFNRLVNEDHIDDLTNIISYLIESTEKVNESIG